MNALATNDPLVRLGQPAQLEAPTQPVPAVSIRKLVTPDYLVCLKDGKKLKMLKRHCGSPPMTGRMLGHAPDLSGFRAQTQ
jgi:predicted transcriptional regulator